MTSTGDGYLTVEVNSSGRVLSANKGFLKTFGLCSIDPASISISLNSPLKGVNKESPIQGILQIDSEQDLECLFFPIQTNKESNTQIYAVAFCQPPIYNFNEAEKMMALKKANRTLEHFALLAAHDLKEPFRTIKNFIELYRQTIDFPLNEEANLYLDMVSKASARMNMLIEGLLHYFRSGQPEFRNLDVQEILDDVITDLAVQIEESQGTILQWNVIDVRGDVSQVYLLFKNLISNSLKFRNENTPVHVKIDAREDGQMIRYTITDNGIGINPKEHKSIFEIFKRLHPKGKYEGAGIGLTFCEKIVEAHGGKIWVESNPEGGATFIFTLPKSQTNT